MSIQSFQMHFCLLFCAFETTNLFQNDYDETIIIDSRNILCLFKSRNVPHLPIVTSQVV